MPYDTCEEFYDIYNFYYSEKVCNRYDQYCCGQCNNRYCCGSSVFRLDQTKCKFIVPTIKPNRGNISLGAWVLATIVFFLIVFFICLIKKSVKSASSSVTPNNQQSLELNSAYSSQIVNDSTHHSSRVNTFDNKVFQADHGLPPSYESILESVKNNNQQTSV
ncbi:unnamed protein product [Brachionus calyciflorus]|uniref:Shisa N-terminal domain-containing protein n=1 Tax=Brachionus calyciflorus TaxID=104777 RepID=A0A813VLX9_9BILA|nr:unnamed protein product [Brachionus calyciflorus]